VRGGAEVTSVASRNFATLLVTLPIVRMGKVRESRDAGLSRGGDGVQVLLQELFRVPFEFLEYDAVAILGMTGYDASLYDDGMAVEPECGLNVSADGEGHHQFDIAAGATEVGGGEAHGDVIAFLAEFDLDLDGVAGMKAAIALG
jgi:hypothetical protein